MHFLNTITGLATLIATITALALPQGTETTGGVGPLVPESVNIAYLQGPWAPTTSSCGTEVANGTLAANTCTDLCVIGVMIAQVPDADCVFTVFKGTRNCVGQYEQVANIIPAGDSSVCIEVGSRWGCSGITGIGSSDRSAAWSCG